MLDNHFISALLIIFICMFLFKLIFICAYFYRSLCVIAVISLSTYALLLLKSFSYNISKLFTSWGNQHDICSIKWHGTIFIFKIRVQGFSRIKVHFVCITIDFCFNSACSPNLDRNCTILPERIWMWIRIS